MLAGRRGRRIDFSCTANVIHKQQIRPSRLFRLKVIQLGRRERGMYLEMKTGRMRKNYIEGHKEIPVYLGYESAEPWKVDKQTV